MDKSEKLTIVATVSGLPVLYAHTYIHVTAIHTDKPVTRISTQYDYNTFDATAHITKSHTFEDIVSKDEVVEYEKKQIEILLERDDFEVLVSEL